MSQVPEVLESLRSIKERAFLDRGRAARVYGHLRRWIQAVELLVMVGGARGRSGCGYQAPASSFLLDQGADGV